jgi:uncharacterized protein (DUF427 family)
LRRFQKKEHADVVQSNRSTPSAFNDWQMKVTLDGVTLAEAPNDQVVSVEGNAYFPPASVVVS